MIEYPSYDLQKLSSTQTTHGGQLLGHRPDSTCCVVTWKVIINILDLFNRHLVWPTISIYGIHRL